MEMIIPHSLLMTSVEIAELTGKEHGHVRRDITVMLETLEKDPSDFGCIYFDSYKRTQPGFQLPYDETICLLTGYDAKARMKVIKRWRELEDQAAAPALPDFSNPAAAARAWADQVDARQALQIELAAAAPAVAFVENYVGSTGLKGFRQVCKLLGANELRFREFLEEKKIMYRLGGEWMPHAAHLDTGRFSVKAGTSDVSGHAYNLAKFTPKGVSWVAGEWAKYQVAPQLEVAL